MGTRSVLVERVSLYCLECGEWVKDKYKYVHECADKTFALVDRTMVGVVDRLYGLGLEPFAAIWSIDAGVEKFGCGISIEFDRDVYMEVLGDLPIGWRYFRARDERDNGIEYVGNVQWESYDGARSELDRVIKAFEKFLDGRDIEGTRSVMTLMAG